MCAIAKESARSRYYANARENIFKMYHVIINAVQVDKDTDYMWENWFSNNNQMNLRTQKQHWLSKLAEDEGFVEKRHSVSQN